MALAHGRAGPQFRVPTQKPPTPLTPTVEGADLRHNGNLWSGRTFPADSRPALGPALKPLAGSGRTIPRTMSLVRRHRQPELMDDPALDPAEHRRALAGLARLNAASGSASVLWPAIRELARLANRPLRVLDLAAGAGDVPAELHRRAVREKLPVEFAGCDLSPVAVEVASRAGSPVRFFPLDVLTDPLPTGFDVFTCSLFLHHLDEPDAVALLRKVRAANPKLLLVNDLRRSRFNYWAVWAASRLLSRSRVVHADGPLSIRGAFTVTEVRAMAAEAGLDGAGVRAKFPCRLLLEWRGSA